MITHEIKDLKPYLGSAVCCVNCGSERVIVKSFETITGWLRIEECLDCGYIWRWRE